MDNRVVIRLTRDVAAGPNQPAQIAGQELTVTDAATAKRLYPTATVRKYADGHEFVAAQDASLIAEAEAAKPKPVKPSKPTESAE